MGCGRTGRGASGKTSSGRQISSPGVALRLTGHTARLRRLRRGTVLQPRLCKDLALGRRARQFRFRFRPRRLAGTVASIGGEDKEKATSRRRLVKIAERDVDREVIGQAPSKMENACKGVAAASEGSYPRLGPGLKTFVINMARRTDRRAHAEELCQQFGLDYEIMEAVDGRALMQQQGSSLDIVGGRSATGQNQAPIDAAATSSSSSSGCPPVARGFQNLKVRMYRAKWDNDGRPSYQLLKMAEHRLLSSSLTQSGHELWGAVGCSLSHQAVLHRLMASPELEWALVLEDDAALNLQAAETRKAFDKEMRYISRHQPDWQLIYLGGHLSTGVSREERANMRLSETLCSGKKIYQTHAFVIRRSLAPAILERLQKGFAADAAFVSWSRIGANSSRTFLFSPQLMVQPGGAHRWKDSDIFVEGEFFKQETMKLDGGDEYKFIASRSKRPANLKKRIARGSVQGLAIHAIVPSTFSQRVSLRLKRPRKALKWQRFLADEASQKVSAVLSNEGLTLFGLSASVRAELLSALPSAFGTSPPGPATSQVGAPRGTAVATGSDSEIDEARASPSAATPFASAGRKSHQSKLILPPDFEVLSRLRASLVKAEEGFRDAVNEAKAALSAEVARGGKSWLQRISRVAKIIDDIQNPKAVIDIEAEVGVGQNCRPLELTASERSCLEILVQCTRKYAAGVATQEELHQVAADAPAVPVGNMELPRLPEAPVLIAMCDAKSVCESRLQSVLEAVHALDEFTAAAIASDAGTVAPASPVAGGRTDSRPSMPPTKAFDLLFGTAVPVASPKAPSPRAKRPRPEETSTSVNAAKSPKVAKRLRHCSLAANASSDSVPAAASTSFTSSAPAPRASPADVDPPGWRRPAAPSTQPTRAAACGPTMTLPRTLPRVPLYATGQPRVSAARAAVTAKMREDAAGTSAFDAVSSMAASRERRPQPTTYSAAVAAAGMKTVGTPSGSSTTRRMPSESAAQRASPRASSKVEVFSMMEKKVELQAMSGSELRMKARYHGVSSDILRNCLEKGDFVQALLDVFKKAFMKS